MSSGLIKINYYKYPGFEIQALALDRHTNVAGLRIVLAKQRVPTENGESMTNLGELQGYYGVFCIQRFDMISG
jgi:hypothetical protein